VTEEFYDRAADPGELKNIFSVNKEAAAGLAGRLFKKLKAAGKAPEYSWPAGISEVAKKKIRDTGYW
jgi:hypothetical protein